MKKVDARSISSSAQEHLRQLAVKAVLDGKKQKEVAQLFGVTPQTICVWVKAYRLQGTEALKSKRKGRPKGGKLLPWQAAQIAKTVIDHHPEQLKLPFYLWTREAVGLLIKRRFGIQLSVWTVGRYLKRWGFTPQKPARRVAVYEDPKNGRLINVWINEHDVGHPAGGNPLLIMDVFEHAYLPDYGLKRGDYIQAFFQNINWSAVEARLRK